LRPAPTICMMLVWNPHMTVERMGAGGSTGWQAPEQLILRSGGEARQGRSVDIFTFGLLLFYCLSGGQHPYGEGVERDYRILNVSPPCPTPDDRACLCWSGQQCSAPIAMQ